MKAAVPLSQAARRRRRRQRQEFVARITVSILILLFNEVVIPYWEGASIIRLTGLSALLLNGPYYVLARTGWRPRVRHGMKTCGAPICQALVSRPARPSASPAQRDRS